MRCGCVQRDCRSDRLILSDAWEFRVSITASLRLLRFVLAIALGMLALPAWAETHAHVNLTPEKLAYLIDPLMEKWIDQHKGPGAVVVVATCDATVFAKGYGLADIEAERPFTTDTTLVRP